MEAVGKEDFFFWRGVRVALRTAIMMMMKSG